MTTGLIFLLINLAVHAEEPLSLFGSKPIQLEVTDKGLQQRKEPGFICDLKAELSGDKYSEWGQSEKDAQALVHKKCSDKSGLLICKKDKITCRQDK
jgi:hypothetical protein